MTTDLSAAERAKRFNELRAKAADLLLQAMMVSPEGTGSIQFEAVKAAHMLCSPFTEIGSYPRPDHILALRDDVKLIAEAVDPLIRAVGDEARAACPYVSDTNVDGCFTDTVTRAVEGDALYVLERAAECLTTEAAVERAERRRA